LYTKVVIEKVKNFFQPTDPIILPETPQIPDLKLIISLIRAKKIFLRQQIVQFFLILAFGI
jgi:hypothetical protein